MTRLLAWLVALVLVYALYVLPQGRRERRARYLLRKRLQAHRSRLRRRLEHRRGTTEATEACDTLPTDTEQEQDTCQPRN